MEHDGLRILVFEGGDLRCISQLKLLQEFMSRAEHDRESKAPEATLQQEGDEFRPCNYFHLIGGVGPSGVIVILLVVFRMTAEDALDAFVYIWNEVFARTDMDPPTRSKRLEEIIEQLLVEKNLPRDLKLRSNVVNDHCKGFVCTALPLRMDYCFIFRTYKTRSQSALRVEPTIIEALRATCALPNLFSPAVLGVNPGSKQEFVTALGSYNPVTEAIKEAFDIYPAEKRVACILNLGCGDKPCVGLPRSFMGNNTDTTSIAGAAAMASIMAIGIPTVSWNATGGFSAAAGLLRALTWGRNSATATSQQNASSSHTLLSSMVGTSSSTTPEHEKYKFMHDVTQNGEPVAHEVEGRIGKYKVYHRFSVDFGLDSNDQLLGNQAGVIEGHTTMYLQKRQVDAAMDECVNGAENYGYTPGNYGCVTIKDVYQFSTNNNAILHGGRAPLPFL